MHSYKKNAFTLVEVSIVLIIVGLVIGAISVGQELIKAAEYRNTIAQTEKLQIAINTFKSKYNCIPGDCNNASALGFNLSPAFLLAAENEYHEKNPFAWLSPISTALADPAPIALNLVDGDGDGTINAYGEYINGIYNLYEASLIQGLSDTTYQLPLKMGAASSTGVQGNWVIYYLEPVTDGSVQVAKHYLWASSVYFNGETGVAVLAPKDAHYIDNKLDDGLPRSGIVLATGRNDMVGTGEVGFPAFDAGADVGPAGATSNFCVTNAATPAYNIVNISRAAGSLCSITIMVSF